MEKSGTLHGNLVEFTCFQAQIGNNSGTMPRGFSELWCFGGFPLSIYIYIYVMQCSIDV